MPPALTLFDQVIAILKQEYINPRNVNLDSLSSQYRPDLEKVCAQETDCSYLKAEPIIKRMLESVDDGHLVYLSKTIAARAEFVGDSFAASQYGFALAWNKNKVVVFTLNPEGNAIGNGVRIGDQILQVDAIKQDSEAIIATLIDGENKQRSATLEMLRPNGERYTVYIKPKMPTNKPTMRYINDVAVMTIPTFNVPLNPITLQVTDFRDFEQRFHTLIFEAQQHGSKRLILDVRNNGGGDPYTAYSLVCGLGVKMARVTEDKKGVTTTITCDGAGKTLVEYSDEPNPIEPYGFDTANPANWTGPVAVLTSRFTGSGAENLADVLQSTKRALIVGEPTVGAMGTDIGSSPLINQATLYYSISMMRDLNGHKPGIRIIPDVLVPLEPEGFVQDRDLQLEAAIAALN